MLSFVALAFRLKRISLCAFSELIQNFMVKSLIPLIR